MGTLIPFIPNRNSEYKSFDEELNILSKKHREVISQRLDNLQKTLSSSDLHFIQTEVPEKLLKVHSTQSFVVKMWSRLSLLYDLLFDQIYPKSARLQKLVAAGLLYFVSPRDFLPDDLPGIGYLDDAYVISEIWNRCFLEITQYLTDKGLDHELYM